MNGNVYGYARVSASDQNEARQTEDLKKCGVRREHIFIDKISGRNFVRPEYLRLRRLLKKGDLLVVTSIDRFGRNYGDIQDEWHYITKTVGADIWVLDMPLLDTRRGKDLTGTLIADIVLQLLSYVAETERANIRRRQAEGIAIARSRGVHLGRPTKPLPPRFSTVYGKYCEGKISRMNAAERLGIKPVQFDYLCKKWKKRRLRAAPPTTCAAPLTR